MRIGIIGTGNMGGALMDAFRLGNHSMRACNHGRAKLEIVCERTGAEPVDSSVKAVEGADLVLLAVKPIVIPSILAEIAPVLKPDQIVVSIAVGLTIESYETVLGKDKKIVRAMPNTPAAVQAGLTAFTFGPNVTEEDQKTVLDLFSLAGGTAVLPERLMNAVCADRFQPGLYIHVYRGYG